MLLSLSRGIEALYGGWGDGRQLVDQFRAATLLCPLAPDGEPMAGELGGLLWLYAFTDEPALARFARARGEGGRRWDFARIGGDLLLDVAVPRLDGPGGVAVDVGGPRPLAFPGTAATATTTRTARTAATAGAVR
ncbi:hypothetical protein ACFYNO_21255 [Kitasatospora sp. NPDC006697]|uniref:hypothetical protein n=1 Tax=Kitasatospora sp. NPDC006697 TaxID=3364020 RepID=UPI00368536BC